MHDYDRVELGLIDRFKVWRARKNADKAAETYYKYEGEHIEVDYSEANALKEKLLQDRRIKIATKDAKRLCRAEHGRNYAGEKEYIEKYLSEKLPKALPEGKEVKNDPSNKNISDSIIDVENPRDNFDYTFQTENGDRYVSLSIIKKPTLSISPNETCVYDASINSSKSFNDTLGRPNDIQFGVDLDRMHEDMDYRNQVIKLVYEKQWDKYTDTINEKKYTGNYIGNVEIDNETGNLSLKKDDIVGQLSIKQQILKEKAKKVFERQMGDHYERAWNKVDKAGKEVDKAGKDVDKAGKDIE